MIVSRNGILLARNFDVVRMASTVVGSTTEALKTLPFKNAINFFDEKVHFNYKDYMVGTLDHF